MPVNWTAENDRKLLLNLITNLSTKDINAEALASLFPGATPKAILERVAKLRRELKAANGAAGTTTTAATTTKPVVTTAATTKPTTKPTTTTPVTIKATTTSPGTTKAATAKAITAKTTATGRKRVRQLEEWEATEDVAVKKRARVREMIEARVREMEMEGEIMKREREVVKSEGCGDDKDFGRDGEMG